MAKAPAKKPDQQQVPSGSPAVRKPKPRSLPPPSELTALSIELDKRSKKPIATKHKILAAEAAARAKPPVPNRRSTAKPTDSANKQKAKPGKVKPPGMMSFLGSQRTSAVKYAKKRSAASVVTSGRTQRSETYLQRRRQEALSNPEMKSWWESKGVQCVVKQAEGNVEVLKKAIEDVDMGAKIVKLISAGLIPPTASQPGKTDRLTTLPPEIRNIIWIMVVVETKFFVWPDSMTGREQPDLAMVNRQIRDEVLPIFYGDNVFAIDLSPFMVRQRPNGEKAPVSGLVAVAKWAKALSEKETFNNVRNWAFEYTPGPAFNVSTMKLGGDSDKSFVVTLKLKKPKSGAKSWAVERLEVHCEARCVLAKDPSCMVMKTPACLNNAVYSVLDTPGYPIIDPGKILGLAEAVMRGAHELALHKCDGGSAQVCGSEDYGFGCG